MEIMRSITIALIVALAALPAANAQQPRPTGTKITGLPALGFDSDEGVGYGALLQFYDYGSEGKTPYRYSLQPTVFLTSRGRRDALIFLDGPHLLGNGWRV